MIVGKRRAIAADTARSMIAGYCWNRAPSHDEYDGDSGSYDNYSSDAQMCVTRGIAAIRELVESTCIKMPIREDGHTQSGETIDDGGCTNPHRPPLRQLRS